MADVRRRVFPLLLFVLTYLCLIVINAILHFPYATDRQSATEHDKAAANFYKWAYAAPTAVTREEREKEEVYVQLGERNARIFNIDGLVRRFVTENGLQHKRVLDIGAGRGYLQDMVDDYVGLDISTTAQHYFHKPYVLASATAMPFHDNEFDAAWTIWVLEHVPNPESALYEMRRVVKPGGVILLAPAWFCTTWAAQGYEVRPYSQFGVGGKIVKASIPIRSTGWFRVSYTLPIRMVRLLASKVSSGPTSFHYTRLTPNYKQYWVPDGDAVNSLDPYEAALWFESRGDRCLNCKGVLGDMSDMTPIIIRIGSKN